MSDKFAVLIDADNVPYSNVKSMFEEITKYGTPTIKRIYGDWSNPSLANGWKNVLLENGITPIQQYSYTTGKNSSDSALIIDAMDILYSGHVSGFCIVSSDSDFTRLVTRLRESSKIVIGIGEKKTPRPFVIACDRFIYLENLEQNPPLDERKGIPDDIVKLIRASINDLADESGWAFLGDLGNLLLKKQPDFDSRNYGFNKLTQLISSINNIEIDRRETSNSRVRHIYIRNK